MDNSFHKDTMNKIRKSIKELYDDEYKILSIFKEDLKSFLKTEKEKHDKFVLKINKVYALYDSIDCSLRRRVGNSLYYDYRIKGLVLNPDATEVGRAFRTSISVKIDDKIEVSDYETFLSLLNKTKKEVFQTTEDNLYTQYMYSIPYGIEDICCGKYAEFLKEDYEKFINVLSKKYPEED